MKKKICPELIYYILPFQYNYCMSDLSALPLLEYSPSSAFHTAILSENISDKSVRPFQNRIREVF